MGDKMIQFEIRIWKEYPATNMKFSAILLCAVFCFAALFLGSAQSSVVETKIYPEDCSKYYRCVDGTCQVWECLQGLEFNPILEACDYIQPVHRTDCTRVRE
ncbi:uncharacterized protein LOC143371766 [Andrena cerasifolii]|uniref:uncharacterized protein LOC143371766 n=1 Tax=Andrena cerasifolii TaxID=2819439 RepID=UPI0040383A58